MSSIVQHWHDMNQSLTPTTIETTSNSGCITCIWPWFFAISRATMQHLPLQIKVVLSVQHIQSLIFSQIITSVYTPVSYLRCVRCVQCPDTRPDTDTQMQLHSITSIFTNNYTNICLRVRVCECVWCLCRCFVVIKSRYSEITWLPHCPFKQASGVIFPSRPFKSSFNPSISFSS